MARIDLLTEQAKEIAGRSDWKPTRFEALPNMKPTFYTLSSKDGFTVSITEEQHALWLAEWVNRTGQCAECAGQGKIVTAWHHDTGCEWKPCRACSGAGKKRHFEAIQQQAEEKKT